MNPPEAIAVIDRFFEALDAIIQNKKIRGIQTFTRKYNINRWNFNTIKKTKEKSFMKSEYLVYIVRDFGVSAHWLLTGEGKMFSEE